MGDRSEPPLDEVQWRSPDIVQSFGGIHTNTVLPYFSQSPFFDRTSNNATLTTQATYNQAMIHILQTREAFEGRLRTMQGLEYMVSSGPDPTLQYQSEVAPPWVIRKQFRRKRAGEADEITVQSAYFVVGQNVYMAPSVGKVLENRILSTITSLTEFFGTCAKLPSFTAASGYAYTPVASRPTATNTSGTEKGDITTTDAPYKSKTLGFGAPVPPSATSKSKEYQDLRMLHEALQLSARYHDNYIDEIPLVGEPGRFILSAKGGHKDAKSQEAPKQASTPALSSAATPSAPTAVAIPQNKVAQSPKEKSPITGSKPKRRKSKAALLSAGTLVGSSS